MAKRVDVLQAFIKTAAISGIALVWVNFTLKDISLALIKSAFKMAWHVISTSPEDENCKDDEFQEPFYDEFEEE